jgi:hypothetical protein
MLIEQIEPSTPQEGRKREQESNCSHKQTLPSTPQEGRKESLRANAHISKQSQAHFKRDEKERLRLRAIAHISKQSQAHFKRDEKQHQADHGPIDAPSID